VVAFLVGGAICTVGQALQGLYIKVGVKPDVASDVTVATLVFLAALATGLGVYDVLGQFGGMGSAVPVTGFANSVVSAALEFKCEGFVLGVGSRMFQLAGPVIAYGALTAFIVALIKALFGGG
jgi:stage V sporulation protein AC